MVCLAYGRRVSDCLLTDRLLLTAPAAHAAAVSAAGPVWRESLASWQVRSVLTGGWGGRSAVLGCAAVCGDQHF